MILWTPDCGMALVSGFSLVIVGEAMPVKNEGMLSLSYGEPLANVILQGFLRNWY